MERHYITIFEDITVQCLHGELPAELLAACDDGLYDIIDVTDPVNPLICRVDGWKPCEILSWGPPETEDIEDIYGVKPPIQ